MVHEKAVVLEVSGRRATVLAAGGEFLRVVPGAGWRAGDEVLLPVAARAARAARRERVASPRVAPPRGGLARPAWRPRLGWAAAAAAAVVALVAFVWPMLSPAPVALAYLTVDINPSLELGVRDDGRVAWARGLNADGRGLLTQVDVRGDLAPAAVEEIVGLACARGYLNRPGPHSVLVAGTLDARQRELTDIESLVAAAEEGAGRALRAHGATAATAAVAVSPELRDEAARLGLSVGKYAVLLEASQVGVDLDPSRLAETGIGHAIIEAGGRPEDILRSAGREKGYDALHKSFKESHEKKAKGDGQGNGQGGGQGQGSGNGRDANPATGDDQGQPPGPGQGNGQGDGQGNGQGDGQGQARGQGRDDERGQPLGHGWGNKGDDGSAGGGRDKDDVNGGGGYSRGGDSGRVITYDAGTPVRPGRGPQ